MRYCEKCGSQLIQSEVFTGRYDTYNGKKLYVYKYNCSKHGEHEKEDTKSFGDKVYNFLTGKS